MGFIIWLTTGILIGWIASLFFKKERNLFSYLTIGVLGSLLGGFLFNLLNIEVNGYLGDLFTSVCGAIIFLFIMNRKK
jgi:uncharacterized membrane protein YeaQ/YmgE (transglycosylase-associated protein family)